MATVRERARRTAPTANSCFLPHRHRGFQRRADTGRAAVPLITALVRGLKRDRATTSSEWQPGMQRSGNHIELIITGGSERRRASRPCTACSDIVMGKRTKHLPSKASPKSSRSGSGRPRTCARRRSAKSGPTQKCAGSAYDGDWAVPDPSGAWMADVGIAPGRGLWRAWSSANMFTGVSQSVKYFQSPAPRALTPPPALRPGPRPALGRVIEYRGNLHLYKNLYQTRSLRSGDLQSAKS